MPTVTWARVDPSRRAAVVEAAEAEFGAHGFSQGSLNVIAKRAGVAKGSLFQYFADKRDLYAFIADIGSQRVRSYMEDRIRELDPSRPFFEFLTDLLDTWVAYFADHPRDRALHGAATLRSTPMPASACGPSSTATTWKSCGRSCATRTFAATCARTAIPTRCCRCC